MDHLLDTHTIIWFINGDSELSEKARKLIEKHSAANFVSVASLWEIAIKVSLGKLELDGPFSEIKNPTRSEWVSTAAYNMGRHLTHRFPAFSSSRSI